MEKALFEASAITGNGPTVAALLAQGDVDVDAYNEEGHTALHLAALAGADDVIAVLLEHDADIHDQAIGGMTPLHCATQNDHVPIIAMLLDGGAEIDAVDDDDSTALHTAARCGSVSSVAFLLAHDADAGLIDSDTRTPLGVAAATGQLEAVKLLYAHHEAELSDDEEDSESGGGEEEIDVEGGEEEDSGSGGDDEEDSEGEDEDDSEGDDEGESESGDEEDESESGDEEDSESDAEEDATAPLYEAAAHGHRAVVEYLLDQGGEKEVHLNGFQALHVAVNRCDKDMVDLLLSRGVDPTRSVIANPDKRGDLGVTLLHNTCMHGQADVVAFLLSLNLNLDKPDQRGRKPLHYAAHGGHHDIVLMLVDYGVEVDTADNHGMTALYCAVQRGFLDTVETLHASGADPNAADHDGATPLHRTASEGNVEVAEFLLSVGADVSATENESGLTPLLAAISNGHYDVVQLLLQHDADTEAVTSDQETTLILAASNGHADIVKLLIDHGANLEATDKPGSTPFLTACWEGHLEAARILLDHDANFDARDHDADTALHYAASEGFLELVKFLLARGAQVDAVNTEGKTPADRALSSGHKDIAMLLGHDATDLEVGKSDGDEDEDGDESQTLHDAALRGDTNGVKAMLDSGDHEIDEEDEDGNTPLHCAAMNGHVDAVELLLDNGADLHAADGEDDTALSYAAINGHTKVVSVLVKRGADIYRVNEDGLGPLHHSAAGNHVETCRLLLALGADILQANEAGTMPIHSATSHGATGALSLLLDFGADIQAVREVGSPLHSAAKNGHLEVVALLLDRGADIDAIDSDGDTPLHVASEAGKTDVVALLLSRGVSLTLAGEVGKSPLMCAAAGGEISTVRYLLECGANVSAIDADGYTALHFAVDNPDIVSLLLHHGALIETTTKRGETPVLMAARCGNVEALSLLLARGGQMNAVNVNGNNPLHTACSELRDAAIEYLLDNGARINASGENGATPLDMALQSKHDEVRETPLKDLRTIVEKMCSRGGKSTGVIRELTKKPMRLGLNACAEHWGTEYDAGLTKLTPVPAEIIKRGEDSVRTYLDDIKNTTAQQMLYRRKVCVVGPSEWGKTSLVTSIVSKRSSLTHIDNRTIGIDLETCSFEKKPLNTDEGDESGNTEPVPIPENHEVTFWDFAGQDVYQVAHALFFSPRTLYVVCVNMEAYARALASVSTQSPLDAEASMASFVKKNVLRWIEIVFTRQPDAQFVVVGTKADRVPSIKTQADIWADLRLRLSTWASHARQDIEASFASTGQQHQSASFVEAMESLLAKVDRVVPQQWIVVSSATQQAVLKARASIEEFVLHRCDESSFPMPRKYKLVLQFIQRHRRVARELANVRDRIENTIVPFGALYSWLVREIGTDLQPTECTAILQTLHDLGDVLWYERESSGYFKSVVILDPTLVLDFVRQVVNHKLEDEVMVAAATSAAAMTVVSGGSTTTTSSIRGARIITPAGGSDGSANEGCLMHRDLVERAFWKDADQELIHAFKMLLQHFQLAYPADGGSLDWDSDLIVPVYWKARFNGSGPRNGATKSTAATTTTTTTTMAQLAASKCVTPACAFTWEYELSEDVCETVFDQFAVQSYSMLFERTVWADCVESSRVGEFVARVGLAPGRRRHQVIKMEVVGRDLKTAWHSLRFFVMALENVLDAYPGLSVSRYIVETRHQDLASAGASSAQRHRLMDAVRALEDAEAMGRSVASLRETMPWLPPDLRWYMEKAWQDPSKLKQIQMQEDMEQVVDKAEVLKRLVVQGDSGRRRLPSLWTLAYTPERDRVMLRLLSDLSGQCFHAPIEIGVPRQVLAKHSGVIQKGVWVCSNVVPECLSLGVFNKAMEMATSALSDHVERAVAVHSLIDRFDVAANTGISTDPSSGGVELKHSLSPRGSAALLRELLQLYDPSIDERCINEVARLECAATSDGCYVWASRQEIMALGDALTPCDGDDFRFKDVVDDGESSDLKQGNEDQLAPVVESSPEDVDVVSYSTLKAKSSGCIPVLLTIVRTTGLPAWDWRRAYCKWELLHPNSNQPVVAGRTGYHELEQSEPTWSVVGFSLLGIRSVEVLRECTLRVRVKRPSRWLGMVKLVGEGSVALRDVVEGGDGSCIHVALDQASKRAVVCELRVV